jgi:hypothetical protein
MSAFDAALAELYRTFDAKPPVAIQGCFCCLDATEREVLLIRPLGVLTSDQLAPYASSIFLTVGDVSDYRYFLPRILDLSASDLTWWPSPELAVGALARAEWDRWSDIERKVIEAFLRAWLDRWASERLSDTRWGEIDSLLCGVARAGLDLTPYLERLLESENLDGLRELNALNGEVATNGGGPRDFWQEAPDSWRRLTDFLTSTAVHDRLSAVAHPSTNTGPQAT